MKYLLHLCLFVAFQSCKKDQTKIHPTLESITESVYASGIVKSKNQYQVYSTVSGIVTEVLVTEGQLVKKGTPLMKIFNKTSALNTQNALLTAEYSKLSTNTDKLNELKMAIDLAMSKMKNDSLLLKRQQILWSQNIGTHLELEQRELSYKNSGNAYQSALIRYNDLKRQLELNARQSQNNFQITNTINADYTIKSEIDGKVYSIVKSVGELVTSLVPLAVIGDDKNFMLELQVDEYDIVKVKEHQKIYVTMDSYKGQTFEAIVTKIDPIMSERSKSFTIEADFVKGPAVLYPYLTTEANIVISTKSNVLTIPRSYLVRESFVITDDNKEKEVTVGLKDYQKAEIQHGLTLDDYILKPEN